MCFVRWLLSKPAEKDRWIISPDSTASRVIFTQFCPGQECISTTLLHVKLTKTIENTCAPVWQQQIEETRTDESHFHLVKDRKQGGENVRIYRANTESMESSYLQN